MAEQIGACNGERLTSLAAHGLDVRREMILLFIASLLINAAILGLVIAVIGKISFIKNFPKFLALICAMMLVWGLVRLVLDGTGWGIPEILIGLALLYIMIHWLFEIPQKRITLIVASYLGIFLGTRLLWAALA